MQGGRQLLDEAEAGTQVERAGPQRVVERVAVDVPHRVPQQLRGATVLADRDDVGVIERGARGQDGFERFAAPLLTPGMRQHLQGDDTPGGDGARAVHTGEWPGPLAPLHAEPGAQLPNDRGVDRGLRRRRGSGTLPLRGSRHLTSSHIYSPRRLTGRGVHSTVTLLARLRGRSTSQPRCTAMW